MPGCPFNIQQEKRTKEAQKDTERKQKAGELRAIQQFFIVTLLV